MTDHGDHALQSVLDTPESQFAQLESVLKLIDGHVQPPSADWFPESEDAYAWTLRRLRALQHHGRVMTAFHLSGRAYQPQIFAALRDADIADAGRAFAAAGNLPAVLVLFRRHPYALISRSLDILAACPETIPPATLEPVLKHLVSLQTPPEPARAPDWIENEATCVALRRRGEHALLLGTEHMARLNLGWAPSTPHQIAHWIRQRAIVVDRCTGQLGLAHELLDLGRGLLGAAFGDTLEELHAAGKQLYFVLGAAAMAPMSAVGLTHAGEGEADAKLHLSGGGGEHGTSKDEDGRDVLVASDHVTPWRLDLGTFAEMDIVNRFLRLFRLIHEDHMHGGITHFVVPFLRQVHADRAEEALHRALETEAVDRLSWVAHFLESELRAPSGALDPPANIVDVAVNAVYASTSFPTLERWSLLESFVELALEAVSNAAIDARQAAALAATVSRLQGHLTAAHILTVHGLPTLPAALRDATPASAEELVRTLLARSARAKLNERKWNELWKDLEMVHHAGFSNFITLDNVRVQFCKALLGCGLIKLANKYMDLLEASSKEQLVIGAARDAFYSEATTSENIVQKAKGILSLLPGNVAAQEEALSIDAAAHLRDLGIDMPPLQVQQTQDKAALLLHALTLAPPTALRDVDGILRLSECLQTSLSRQKVLAHLAEAALAAGDIKLAESVCLQLAAQHEEEGWSVAAELAMEQSCTDATTRRSLLSYAMRFAPADALARQLRCWQACGLPEEAWNTEQPGSTASNELYIASAQDVLQQFLDGSGAPLHGGNGDEDVVLLFTSLFALAPSGIMQWALRVKAEKAKLPPAALRRAHVAIVTATAVTLRLVHGLYPGSNSIGILPKVLLKHTATLAAGDAKGSAGVPSCTGLPAEASTMEESAPRPTSSTSRGSNIDSALLAEGSGGSASGVSRGSPSPGPMPHPVVVESANLAALKALLLETCGELAAAADAQRVARLLPDRQSAGIWAGGDIEAQRRMVLRMAAAAGSGAGNVQWMDKGESRSLTQEDETCVGMQEESLDAAISLADRCGVSRWHVKLEFARAVVQRPGPVENARAAAAAVLDDLVKERPRDTLVAFITRVYDECESTGPDSAERLALALQLCEASCRGLIAHHDDDKTQPISHNLDARAASEALRGLSKSILSLERVSGSGMDLKAFVDPSMNVLSQCVHARDANEFAVIDAKREQNRAIRDRIAAELVEHCTADNAHSMATVLDDIRQHHEALLRACAVPDNTVEMKGSADSATSLPPLSKMVMMAAASHELASLAIAETMEKEQRQRLLDYMRSAGPALAIVLARFACLDGEPPMALPASPPLLSSAQALEVLRLALQVVDDGAMRENQVAWSETVQAHLNEVRKECMRLDVIQKLWSSLCSMGDDAQMAAAASQMVSDAQESVARGDLQRAEESVTSFLEELLTAGCPCSEVAHAAAACGALFSPMAPVSSSSSSSSYDTSLLNEEISGVKPPLQLVARAVQNAVDKSLQTLSGHIDPESPCRLSAGDAFQNLYGVLRSLDETQADASDAIVTAADMKPLRDMMHAALYHHATRQIPDRDASAAEAHVQILQILGTLGSSLWAGWEPPEGMQKVDFKHGEALLHSQAAASLAVGWPGISQRIHMTSKDFSSVEAVEAMLMRLLDAAETTEQLLAVVALLADLLFDAFAFADVATLLSSSSRPGTSKDTDFVETEASLLHPLHRPWAVSLSGLVRLGAVDAALAAFDRSTTGTGRAATASSSMTEGEIESLVRVADGAAGILAASAVALLGTYAPLHDAACERLESLRGGDDVQGLPASVPLFLALLEKKRLSPLASRNPALFRHLCMVMLRGRAPALSARGGIEGCPEIPVRTAVSCAAAAELVIAGEVSAAAWIAMEHSGTHPLLRVMDSGASVLSTLFKMGARSAHALANAELSQDAAAVVGVARCAERVISMVPELSNAALQKLRDDGVLSLERGYC